MKKTLFMAALFFMPFFAYANEYRWVDFVLANGQKFWAIQIVQKAKAVEIPIEEIVLDYIWKFDGLHGVSAKTIERVARCESGLNPYAVGDKGMAYGPMQFWESSFNRMKSKSDVYDLDYHNWMHQIDLAYWAFSKEYKKEWTCK